MRVSYVTVMLCCVQGRGVTSLPFASWWACRLLPASACSPLPWWPDGTYRPPPALCLHEGLLTGVLVLRPGYLAYAVPRSAVLWAGPIVAWALLSVLTALTATVISAS